MQYVTVDGTHPFMENCWTKLLQHYDPLETPLMKTGLGMESNVFGKVMAK